ncbi:MAG: hypothetical protein RL131_814, partial [Bacteroidota bacterium]
MATANQGFITRNFILQTPLAEKLYFEYAAPQPIIDFHSHLPPSELAENKQYANITELWLKGDHYKWRAMRAAGVNERFITGDASDQEKFHAWAKTVPLTVRNPLFHWTYLELKNSFGIEQYLNPETANDIYAQCNQLLSGSTHTARKFLESYRVVYQ